MNAAGEEYPPPSVATGTLNNIAASGAAPVTMQNSTEGNPSTPPASGPEGAVVVGEEVLRAGDAVIELPIDGIQHGP